VSCCGWDVEYAQLCTASPGVLLPTDGLIVLCPPERGCTDAIAHRADDGQWHTAHGNRIGEWHEQRAPQQLTLDAA